MMVDDAIMKLRGVKKSFGSIQVLQGIDLDIRRGRVHGLLGANGAGKSTLIKIISGSYPITDGQITWQGEEVRWANPKQANDMGVATIHQHIPLIPTLTVLENVFLGTKGFLRVNAAMRRRLSDICERVGYHLEADVPVEHLSIGAQQMVAIFKALATGAELIIMDEPTASLAIEEREVVYEIIKRLSRQENKAILFVSHFLDEIISLTDEVTVLRNGLSVMRSETKDLDEARIAEAIVGREIVALEKAAADRTERCVSLDSTPLLEAREIHLSNRLAPLSLRVCAGEVIGVAGLLGSGRSELLHSIFRSEKEAGGEILVQGKSIRRSPAAAVKAGLALVPEDRFRQGLVPTFEIWRNVTLPALEQVTRYFFLLDRKKEMGLGWKSLRDLSIKATSPDQLVADLSGGNAQKVTIAKWLNSDVRIFLLDEPTAGIDIGAKTEILKLVRKLADAGKAVIMVSSEFEELLAVSDRIVILRDGRMVAERRAHETSEQELLLLAGG